MNMGPKVNAKKSSEKNRQITIEMKKKIIAKYEKGTHVVDLALQYN